MKKTLFLLLSCLLLAGTGFSQTPQADVKGSKDHPMLTRMPDFRISSYTETEFGAQKFTGADKKITEVEGRKYYIEYRLNTGVVSPGELKIRRNVQDALKKIGGKVLYDENFNRFSTILVEKDGKQTWFEVRTNDQWYRMTIVEREAMEQEIVANADAMGNDIKNTGHVSVYGIYFDTGKSEIKPESDLAIEQISLLLKNNASLSLYVVGHTDNVGTIDSNMKLSQERALSVINMLVSKYGIPATRLKPYGVASLSPVASNDTDDGKAKNRRVELVKQ
ncbi:MAG TPA: OmpA family protein [Bacteroidales bacterium]|nr:OmpA family protein [Bacteroidales bacterium]